MQTYEIIVSGRDIRANSPDVTLVRTSVGVDQIHVLFDNAEWLSFPVSATFGNGDVVRTTSLSMGAVTSDEWAAEGSCEIPWEVIEDIGDVRITFQGTDSGGNHIITAYGAPLKVVQEGEVPSGSAPAPTPTVSEWEQAYANAMEAVSGAETVVADFQERIDDIVEEARQSISGGGSVDIATTEAPGIVQPDGESILIDADGIISAAETNGITVDQVKALTNLRILAANAFTTTFDDDGTLVGAVVNSNNLPVATSTTKGIVLTDGSSIVLTKDRISVNSTWLQSQLSTLDGALKWKGVAESVEELPSDASVGDVYIVQGSTLFWDGEQWSEISSAIDLTPYERSDNLSEITAAEVHAITAHHGEYGSMALYVTADYLNAQLDAYRQGIDADVEQDVSELSDRVDAIMEALANGRY